MKSRPSTSSVLQLVHLAGTAPPPHHFVPYSLSSFIRHRQIIPIAKSSRIKNRFWLRPTRLGIFRDRPSAFVRWRTVVRLRSDFVREIKFSKIHTYCNYYFLCFSTALSSSPRAPHTVHVPLPPNTRTP